MNLYLLRHGEAEGFAVSDDSRALTERGEADVLDVAQQFSQENIVLARCYVSPYLRAQQTANLFISQLSQKIKIETCTKLRPETALQEVITFLESQTSENILLVSHNPLLTELYAMLSRGHIEDLKIVSTSELNEIVMDIVGIGQGTSKLNLIPSK